MTNNGFKMVMCRDVRITSALETAVHEMMADKIRLYFHAAGLAGIDPRHLEAVGKETLLGMVENIMDRLWRSTLRNYPCGEPDENEIVGVANYLMDLVNLVAVDKPCCMPMYRNDEEHFNAGTLVRVFYKGVWVPGTVLMAPKLSVDFRDPTAVYMLMTVEIRGDEPQALQYDYRDIRVLQEVEYLNIKTGFDEEFLGILRENVKGTAIESDNRFADERIAAVEKLIELSLDPTEQIYRFITEGEKVAIMWNHMWVKARVCQTEYEYYPAVVETEGDEPQAVTVTIYDRVIPLKLLELLVEESRIPEDMIATIITKDI